jgi:hypothetical protein
MLIDLRTTYVIVSITCLTLGTMQLLVFYMRQFERWPLLWGASNVLVGLGTLGVALRGIAPDLVSIQLSNIITVVGYGLLLSSVKAFAGQRPFQLADVLPAAATVVLLGFVLNGEEQYRARIAVASALFSLFDVRIVIDGIHLARREGLACAWMLAGAFAMTASAFAVRTVMSITGNIGGPDIFSGHTGPYQWMAATGAVFVTVRGFILVMIAAERNHKLLLAQAHQDALTGAMNRNGLQRSFARFARGLAARPGSMISLLVIDLDHFESVNDTHGHTAGDEVLRLFASVAHGVLRGTDRLAGRRRVRGDASRRPAARGRGDCGVHPARVHRRIPDAVRPDPDADAQYRRNAGRCERREP